ncbi:MAG: hypothetical protein SFV52_05495 [Saprospiraceae bacterium]|nr:hypothetical protein [Saprospiraceae bacterium]
MLNRNRVITGLLVGLLLPTLGFILLYQIFKILEIKGAASGDGFSPMFRERTLSIIAIALNLIPLNLFRKQRAEDAMRGIVIASFVLVIAWVAYFRHYIL